MKRSKHPLHDLDQEIRAHLDLATQENIDRGMSPEDARHAAIRKFGNITHVKEDAHAIWTAIWLDQLLQDIRLTLRSLRKSPAFAITAILTLALGIATTTAIFSLVSGVVLRPLPFPEPNRLVSIETQTFPQSTPQTNAPAAGIPTDTSYPDFFDWRDQSLSFANITTYAPATTRKFTPPGNGTPRIVSAVAVSANFFETLGVAPLLGRTLSFEDEKPDNNSLVLSHAFWVSDFSSDPNVIGKSITVSDKSWTVVGVMPPGFDFPYEHESPNFWAILTNRLFTSAMLTGTRSDRSGRVIARLRPGVTIAQAQAEMSTVQRNLANTYPEDRLQFAVEIHPLLDHLSESYRDPLYLLLAAVIALLLIACVNVAGLMLARGLARSKEFAVRVAIGARSTHIFRQVLVESTALACIGGALGVLLAHLFLNIFLTLAPIDVPRLREIHIDAVALTFAVAVSLLTGILFGILPAWSATRIDSAKNFWSTGSRITRGRGELTLHMGLVVAETAISLILLASSGLLIRSFFEATKVDPGFDPHHILTFRLGLSTAHYPPEKAALFFRQFIPTLSALPGVESVSASYPTPFAWDHGAEFTLPGQPYDPSDPPTAQRTIVEPNFFETLRIPLLRGRTFTAADNATSKPVAVVTESFARTWFPGVDPLGRSILPKVANSYEKSAWTEIVGVVADIHSVNLTDPIAPEFFLPYEQRNDVPQGILMRVHGDPKSYINTVRSIVANLDRDVPVFVVATLDEYIRDSNNNTAFEAKLLSFFAISALLLAALGIYAALSAMVTRRTFELGVRMALGAQRHNVFQFVVRRGMFLALAGLAIGFVGFLLTARFVADLLFNVQPFDPLNVAAVVTILLAVSFAATAIPARRATKVDPIIALRYE